MFDFCLNSFEYPQGEVKSPEAPPHLTGTGLDKNLRESFFKLGKKSFPDRFFTGKYRRKSNTGGGYEGLHQFTGQKLIREKSAKIENFCAKTAVFCSKFCPFLHKFRLFFA